MSKDVEHCMECGCYIAHSYYINSIGPYCYDCFVDLSDKSFHTSYIFAKLDEEI